MQAAPHRPPYVLAIDGGTEALKAGLFDLAGRRIAVASRPYPTRFPQAGWAEQDPAHWWEALVEAVRACVVAAGVPVEEIAGISADGTTSTVVLLGADGEPLCPAVLWMDVRANEQAQRIFATGHPALCCCPAGVNAEWMLPKLLWLKQHEPALWHDTACVYEYTDWIAHRLTGRRTLNRNTTTQRWFYGAAGAGWPDDLLAACGLDDLAMRRPESILRAGEVVDVLSREAATALGLRPGIPVAAGGGDAFIGLLGLGVTQPGDMGIVMGSSNVLSALASQPLHFPGIFGSFPDALLPGLHLVEAGQVSTGAVLSWFKRNFGAGAAADALARGLSPYQLLDAEAAQVAPGSGGLIVLDYFQGNRTPHTDAAASGVIWGLSLQSDRAHVFRALMEGIAYGMADILDTLARNDFVVQRIIASGGATHSPLFMQIYADVIGRSIAVTCEPEASLLGTAAVAAVGAGLAPDLATAAARMVQVAAEYRPDLSAVAEYRFYQELHRETYPRLRDLMHRMRARRG